MRNNSFISRFLICALFLIIGMIIHNLLAHCSIFGNDFLKMKLIDIIDLVVYVIFGVFFLFYFTQKDSDNRKRKDILLLLLQELTEYLLNNEDYMISYVKNYDPKNQITQEIQENRKKILSITKRFVNKINCINEVEVCESSKLNIIKNDLENLRTLITGDDWSDFEVYNKETIKKIEKIFPIIYLNIDKARINLFPESHY